MQQPYEYDTKFKGAAWKSLVAEFIDTWSLQFVYFYLFVEDAFIFTHIAYL